MSNVFNSTVTPFFPVPQHTIRTGLLKTMRSAEVNLWLALLHEAQRVTSALLPRSNAQIRELVGLSDSSIRTGRTKGIEHGLWLARRGLGGVYWYWLLEPETGFRLPAAKRVPLGNPFAREDSGGPAVAGPAAALSGVVLDWSDSRPDSIAKSGS